MEFGAGGGGGGTTSGVSSSSSGGKMIIRQKYGPSGEPLLLLASGIVAHCKIGRGTAAERGGGGGGGAEGSGGARSTSPYSFYSAEMSEDGVLVASEEEDETEEADEGKRDEDRNEQEEDRRGRREEHRRIDGMAAAEALAARQGTFSKTSEGCHTWRSVSGVVSGFEIARNGQFTCPVGCGAIFLSPGPPGSSFPVSVSSDDADVCVDLNAG